MPFTIIRAAASWFIGWVLGKIFRRSPEAQARADGETAQKLADTQAALATQQREAKALQAAPHSDDELLRMLNKGEMP